MHEIHGGPCLKRLSLPLGTFFDFFYFPFKSFKSRIKLCFDNKSVHYYTIIDFNEVDMRIYLPEKVIIHRGR